ncbi:MAG: enoyl-CoA hydratase-related protein [Pseudomonadota bacterium]
MSYENILIEDVDGVRIITMNRPERLNAWTHQMGGEMRVAVEAANEDEDIFGIVVTGAGRGFCAGADIEAVFKAQADGSADQEGPSMGDWVSLMRDSKPIVAAINGAAVGVGLTQVLPMDYLIASESAKLSVRFVKMGLVPELASSHFLMARMGWGQASELMLTGKTVMAEEAKELGLVDKVVSSNELIESACNLAREMGNNPLSALKHIKALITVNASEADLKEVQKRELAALELCYASAEHHEAIDAFMNKREPDFKKARASQE